MRKHTFIKRAVATILAMCMMVGMGTTVFAEEGDARYVPDAISLTIYAGYSRDSSAGDWGHSFIGIENYTGRPITVGKMSVANGYGVSVGTFNASVEPDGVYYNREYHVNDRTYYSHTTTITDSQLKTLSTYINTHDNWSEAENCSVFAARAWNTVATPKFPTSYFTSPNDIANAIKTQNYEVGASFPAHGSVYYADNGKLTYSLHN